MGESCPIYRTTAGFVIIVNNWNFYVIMSLEKAQHIEEKGLQSVHFKKDAGFITSALRETELFTRCLYFVSHREIKKIFCFSYSGSMRCGRSGLKTQIKERFASRIDRIHFPEEPVYSCCNWILILEKIFNSSVRNC